jgi:tRNA threonylcarbamoyladenosine modification (KEOPS) complex Cgi121 subunit
MRQRVYKLTDTYASIIGFRTKITDGKGYGSIIRDVGNMCDQVSLLAVNANIVYGIEHAIDVLKITLEAKRRNMMIAKKEETDILLRLLCTTQISVALRSGGLKNHNYGCFILFSKNKSQLLKVRKNIGKLFEVKNEVLRANKKKRKIISGILGLPFNKSISDDDKTFTKYLSERACLITK